MEWLRLWVSTLDNPKVQALPAGIFKAWVNCLCLVRGNDGILPESDATSFRLRVTTRQWEKWKNCLIQAGLIDVAEDGTCRMHDWNQHQYVSDGSTERVRKHREKQRRNVSGNVSETPPDTEQNRNRTETDSEADEKLITDASRKAPMRSPFPELSVSQSLPAGWTDVDVLNLQEQLVAIMDGDQAPANLTEWILHDLAQKHSLSANEIRDALQAAWHRNRRKAPRNWNWFREVLRVAFVPGYAARLPEAPAVTGRSELDRETFRKMTEAIELVARSACALSPRPSPAAPKP